MKLCSNQGHRKVMSLAWHNERLCCSDLLIKRFTTFDNTQVLQGIIDSVK